MGNRTTMATAQSLASRPSPPASLPSIEEARLYFYRPGEAIASGEIGIGDGVHIVHRWREEGRGRMRVIFASTGKAILLTSLTTMLGFGSLVFSIWRGFGHLGGALFLGVGACFLTTVVFLAALIGASERRRRGDSPASPPVSPSA